MNDLLIVLVIGIMAGIIDINPIMIIVSSKDKKALIPMIIFSAILGIEIAVAGAKFIW